jgi:uncharacterized protein DUF1707
VSKVPELRVSDTDRERVALQLRDHAVQGRLTLAELSDRTEKAYLARTVDQLDALTRDLPAATAGTGRTRAKHLTATLFGSVERKGRWRLGRSSLALVGFGNIDLDLRQAELAAPKASILCLLLFGNVDVYVPPGVEVDVGGFCVFGHRRDWGDDSAPKPGAPLLRVRVFSLFGTADVWRVPLELGKLDFRGVIKALRSRDRDELPG